MFGRPKRAVFSMATSAWAVHVRSGESRISMGATQPVALSVDHSQLGMGAPTFSTSVCNSGASFSAFEMTLTEGNKLEKKLFYSTFATVSNKYPA